MYEHVKTGCKHIPPSEQPLQFQSGYFLNKPRILKEIQTPYILPRTDTETFPPTDKFLYPKVFYFYTALSLTVEELNTRSAA